jgi:hypothetical protein
MRSRFPGNRAAECALTSEVLVFVDERRKEITCFPFFEMIL